MLKCKILRRLDLTSRLKIEYLAGTKQKSFLKSCIQIRLNECVCIHARDKYKGYILEVVDRM